MCKNFKLMLHFFNNIMSKIILKIIEKDI